MAPQGATLGAGIRVRRKKAGLTLKELGERAELSIPFISQIERDLAYPSMSSLRRLAEALGTSPQSLLAGDTRSSEDARESSHSLPVVDAGPAEGTCQLLGPTHPDLHILEFTGAPPAFREYWRHRGREHVYVVDGTVEVDVDGTISRLEAGESFSFNPANPHRYRQASQTTVRFLLIESPESIDETS